jgi:hypothetical protein
MAGSAAAVCFLSSVIALLCLYQLLLPVPVPVPAAGPVGALRRAGRHHQHHHVLTTPLASSSSSSSGEREHEHHGLPDIETFRDALDRLPADWSGFDAELGPLSRYFGPAAPLGVRERLVYLFAVLDRSPRDGGVSLAELEAWLRRQAAARLEAATRREMAKHDRNGDGAVTLSEYRGISISILTRSMPVQLQLQDR